MSQTPDRAVAADSAIPDTPPSAPPSADERAQAARAHLSVWLSVLPLVGVFAAVGIYSRNQRVSPWVSQQALQSALFQIILFNLAIMLLAFVVPLSALAWDSTYDGGSLVLAVALTALPFVAITYLAQGLLATRAARAVRRGEHFRHPVVGRLVGPPAATAAQLAGEPGAATGGAQPTAG